MNHLREIHHKGATTQLQTVLQILQFTKYRSWKIRVSLFYVRFPVDSMRLATLTVSPKRQYLGIVTPTTPPTTEPLCMPQRIINLRSGR